MFVIRRIQCKGLYRQYSSTLAESFYNEEQWELQKVTKKLIDNEINPFVDEHWTGGMLCVQQVDNQDKHKAHWRSLKRKKQQLKTILLPLACDDQVPGLSVPGIRSHLATALPDALILSCVGQFCQCMCLSLPDNATSLVKATNRNSKFYIRIYNS